MGTLEFARNLYPDPSHEYGLGPLPNTADSGNGTITLDPTLSHTGKQSIKITNNDPATILATNLINDPDGYQNNAAHWVIQGSSGTPTIETGSGWFGVSWATAGPGSTAGMSYGYTAQASAPELAVSPGDVRSASVQVWSNIAQNMRLAMNYLADGSTASLLSINSANVAVPANTWTTISINAGTTNNAPAGATRLALRPLVTVAPAAGTEVRARYLTLVNGPTAVEPFSGNTPITATALYRWVGPANNSASIQVGGTPQDCYATAPLGTCADLGLRGGSTATFAVWVNIPSSVAAPSSKIASIGGTGVRKIDIPAAGLPRDTWTQVTGKTTILADTGTIQVTIWAPGLYGDSHSFDDFTVAAGGQPRDFNGDTEASDDYSYSWADVPGQSASIQYEITPDPTLSTWQGHDGSVWDLTNEAGGVYLTRGGVIGLGGVQSDSYDTTAAGIPGQRHRGSRPQARSVEWPVFLFNDQSSAAWRQHVTRFWRSFHRDRTGTWTVTLDGGERRYLDLRLNPDFADAGYDLDPLKYGWAQYTIELIADHPFWRGDPLTTEWASSQPTTPFFDPGGSPPFHIVSTGAQITNPGDEDAWPIITLRNVAGVRIQIGDGMIQPPEAYSDGLVIDTSPLNPTAVRGSGADAFSDIHIYDPRPIPAGQTIPLNITMSGTGTISMTITPLYERIY